LKHRIVEDTVKFLFKLEVKTDQEVQQERSHRVTHTNREEERDLTVRRAGKKIGRNDQCWCGSGKKWKKCHYPDEG
ncbi:MAG: SEC-C domain-containing protein, partial [Candidatus Eremiobacteraeota bacterium]|nr:SEC-C domain-containing protein [Candidatus Eremiobacteraeota bacterium]